MIKISQQQICEIENAQYEALAQRIQTNWPSISAALYPELICISPDEQHKWIQRVMSSCREHIDNEDAIIALVTDVLSAKTLGLSDEFIAEMTNYFLICAADGANHTEAQDWITWVLFEQHELKRKATSNRLAR